MARLGRSYAKSRLGKPTVVGAAVTFRPPQITLSVKLTTQARPPQRVARSFLKPPATVGPPTVFRPVKTTLAPSSRLARVTHSRKLSPAPYAAPPITYRPVQAKLAPSTRLSRAPHSRKITPAVVAAAVTFGPVTIKLVRTPRQPAATHSRLRPPPPAVAAPIVYAPVMVRLASSRLARAAHSFRTTVTPTSGVVVPPVLIPLRVVLAASSRLARATHSRTKPPTTVAPAITFPPAKVTLAAQPRPPRYRTRSFFTQAPQFAAVVPPPTLEQLKPRVFLTRRGPVRLTQSKLRPPAFVAYPATQEQRTVRLHLAPHPKQGRRTMWKLRPPTVIGAFQNLAPPYLEGDSGGADFEGPGGSLTPTGGPGSSDFEGVAGVTG